jgi:hypothetical protein
MPANGRENVLPAGGDGQVFRIADRKHGQGRASLPDGRGGIKWRVPDSRRGQKRQARKSLLQIIYDL